MNSSGKVHGFKIDSAAKLLTQCEAAMGSNLDESFSLSEDVLNEFGIVGSEAIYDLNPIPFDPSLLARLNAAIVRIKRQHFLTVHAIDYGTQSEARSRFVEFSKTFKAYLTDISVNLYVHLRHSVADFDEEASFLSEFESHTRVLVEEYTDFINDFVESDVFMDDVFKAKFIELGARFLRRTNQEKKYLFPLYKPVF